MEGYFRSTWIYLLSETENKPSTSLKISPVKMIIDLVEQLVLPAETGSLTSLAGQRQPQKPDETDSPRGLNKFLTGGFLQFHQQSSGSN